MSDTEVNSDDLVKAASIFDIYETDVSAEEDGKWFENFKETGIDLKIARFQSKRSIKAREKHEAAYRRFQKKGKLPEEIAEKVIVEQMADAILLDWRKMPDRDGAEIVYSRAAAAMLLTKLPNFRLDIIQTAVDMDNYRVEDKKATLGN